MIENSVSNFVSKNFADIMTNGEIEAIENFETVIGLALDYCVKFTVLDALNLGYNVTLIPELCRSIGDADAAIAEMVAAGAKIEKIER